MIPKDCKRLAEVDFPIAEVSRHAAREKSIRHGHPLTLHLWWARRHAVPRRPAQPAIPPGTTGLGDRAWRMERDGRSWIMNLKGLSWKEPQGLCLKDCEDAYLQAERWRRVLPEDRHHPHRPPIRVEAEGHVSPIAFYEAPELGSGLPDDGVESLFSLPCL